MPLIRYPGSKEKLFDALLRYVPYCVSLPMMSAESVTEYREPFFGAGAIGFRLLNTMSSKCVVWLNDIDADLVCLWKAVHSDYRQLQKLIHEFKPSVEAFFDFKSRDGMADCSPTERGFRKLALHRMSVSGFGAMSGGPIGGKSQENKLYTVSCRWNPTRMKRDVTRLSLRLNRFKRLSITCADFGDVIEAPGDNVFIYIDPPYFEKGPQLYKHSMQESCHERLSSMLAASSHDWLLSYDDHPYVRSLYQWAKIEVLSVRYTNAVTKTNRPKNREVAIMPAHSLSAT
jgi:DNA adenine methylase